MNQKLNYYDVIAIYIPGAVWIAITFYLFFLDDATALRDVLNIHIGTSLIVMVLIYAVGEMLQAVGLIVQRIFWKIFGGWPVLWIADDNNSFIVSFLNRTFLPFMTEKEAQLIKEAILEDAHKELLKRDINRLYPDIIQKANTLETFGHNVNVMRSMANFHRGMIVVALWTILVCFIKGGYLIFCDSCTVCFQFDMNDTRMNWLIIVALLVLFLSSYRFYHFSVHHAKYLYRGYLAYIKNNLAKKNKDGQNGEIKNREQKNSDSSGDGVFGSNDSFQEAKRDAGASENGESNSGND